MINFKKFDTVQEYEAYLSNKDEFVTPSISYCEENDTTYYAKTPQYRTTSGESYCSGASGYDKYVDVYSQISYDDGVSWATTATTSTLVEADSDDCKPQYRTTSGETYCSGATGYDKYVDVYSEISYDKGETWEVTATTPTLVEADSDDCKQSFKTITYSGSSKLSETTATGKTSGLHTNSFVGQNGRLTITSHTFSNGVGTIEFSDNVTGMTGHSFYGCNTMTGLELPNSITSIGDLSLFNCSILTNVNIPSGVTNMGIGVFYTCSSLTSLDIPSGVTSISSAFCYSCTSLTSVNISSNVTSIGNQAFQYCSGLTSVIISAAAPPSLGSSAFSNVNSNCKIYVPSGSVNTYKSASGWSTYASMIQAIP